MLVLILILMFMLVHIHTLIFFLLPRYGAGEVAKQEPVPPTTATASTDEAVGVENEDEHIGTGDVGTDADGGALK